MNERLGSIDMSAKSGTDVDLGDEEEGGVNTHRAYDLCIKQRS